MPVTSGEFQYRDHFGPEAMRTNLLVQGGIVSAFPKTRDAWDRTGKAEDREAMDVLGRRRNSYIRLPDVEWTSAAESAVYYDGILPVMKVAWPYPNEQVQWLARWASCLNENERLLKLLRDVWLLRTPIMCEEHKKFCDHLGYTFYQTMEGQMRNLLAVFFIQVQPPGMPPPPVSFRFEKFLERRGKSPRFGSLT